jgi:hypothetical protein
MKSYFSEEYAEITKKHMKRGGIASPIREMQIKTTVKYQSHSQMCVKI